MTLDHALTVTRAMLGRAKYCFLITHGTEGWCSARLVQPIVDDSEAFVLWFGTNPTLRKVQEIENHPRVTVAIQNRRENANLVLYGTARVERDVALRRRWWMGTWRLFLPNGPAGDPYVVLRFEAERVELLNFRRDIIPEPFGLRPLVLVQREGWALDEPERA